MGGSEGTVGSRETGLVAVEGAMLVAGGDAGAFHEPSQALLDLALAGFEGVASAGIRENPHAGAAASGTNGDHGNDSVSQVRRGGKGGGSVGSRERRSDASLERVFALGADNRALSAARGGVGSAAKSGQPVRKPWIDRFLALLNPEARFPGPGLRSGGADCGISDPVGTSGNRGGCIVAAAGEGARAVPRGGVDSGRHARSGTGAAL